MGTTAEKLTYLNDTKGLLKNNINLTGAGLTNQTPFRQYATDLKTALLNILNNGIDTLYNNFPKTTGRGTNITLNNTLQAPIRSVINGDTEQNSYSGKNLLNAKDYLYGTSNGIKTTYENNSYVLNGTASASWCYIANNVPINLSEGTYTLSITKALTHRIYITFKFEDNSTGTLAINAGNTSASYTINKKVVSYELSCANMTSGTTYNETIGIQLEQGSATSYEPYVGGIASPNPDYPQEIKSVTGLQKVTISGGTGTTPQEYEINLGKNLLNSNANSTTKNGITFTNNNGIFSISGTATANTGLSLTTNTIILENNTAYTQSVITESGTQNVNVVPAFKNSQGTVQYNYFTNNQTKTTTDKMTLYSYDIYIPNGTTVNWSFKVQLEKGTQATSYSPYFTPIHLYENDQIIGTPYNWSIYRENGEVVFDGVNIKFQSKHSSISSETKGFYKAVLTNKNKIIDSGATDAAFSDNFKFVSGYALTAFNNNDSGAWWEKGTDNIYVILEETSLVDANAWLQTHNTKVVYPLAEPTTEPITNTELISQLNEIYNLHSYNGTTNITITSEDLELIMTASALKGE